MATEKMNMCEGPFLKKIIRFTVPVMLTGLLQLAFNAADLIVVGQFCGSTAVGAVGATGSLTSLFVNLFMGLSVGAGVAVAQALGAKDDGTARKTVHTAFPVALLCGIALSLVGLLLSEPMLKLMDTPEAELPLAVLYMKIYFCGSAASLVYNFGAAILRAAGDTKGPLMFLSVAGALNVGLNTLFVTVFSMSADGVALATVLAQCLSAALVVRALSKRSDPWRLSFSALRIYPAPLRKILSVGIPSGIQSSLFSIANVQIQSAINSFGSTFLSGNSAASNVGSFPLSATNSVYHAAVNFAGQNVGANRPENVRKIFRASCLCATVIGCILGALLMIFARPLLGIYITDSPQAIDDGVLRILCIYAPCALAGIMEVSTGVLRGMGKSVAPMITSILGICALRVLWLKTLFVWFPTPECLHISFPASWLLTFLVQYVIFRHYLKKFTGNTLREVTT